MKRLLLTTAIVALAAAANLSPAAAEGPKASGNHAIPEAAYGATPRALHYEWQYGYIGHHPRYQAHWVLVP